MLSKKLVLTAGAILLLSTSGAMAQSAAARAVLGACKPDQKPGDIVMPGGFKLNIKDADKLKGLLPK